MGRRPAPIQKSCLRKEGDAGTDAGQQRAAPVPIDQPRQQLRMTLHPFGRQRAGRRDENEIGPPDIADAHIGRDAKAIGALDRRAVDGCHRHAKPGLRSAAAHYVPQRSGGGKDLDRPYRCRRIALVDQDDRDIQHVVRFAVILDPSHPSIIGWNPGRIQSERPLCHFHPPRMSLPATSGGRSLAPSSRQLAGRAAQKGGI
jgi:hypothetical protein